MEGNIEKIQEIDYMKEYKDFMDIYKRDAASGEEVGATIARLAQFYAMYNMDMVNKERKLSMIARDIEARVDDNGKPISSTKAKVYTDATDEAFAYNIARAHVQNIEQFINSLKALQKGILNEYSHQGLA